MNHSQRARETPLKAWILADKSGDVVMGHCNCMAGLGEACSHIGAILFACEAAVRIQKSVTCTQEANKWLPSHVKKIPYLPVNAVDFSSAKRKYQKLCSHDEDSQIHFKRKRNVAPPNHEEQSKFFENISKSNTKSVVLSVIDPYNKSFKHQNTDLPVPLTSFYKEENTELTYSELLKVCDETTISLTSSQCELVERQTRKQASSRVWFEQRRGRITASKLKAACHTNIEKPSKSLIQGICYPESHRFSTAATRWGCKHESTAREQYEQTMNASHDRFTVSDSGLNINPKYPHLGATPDGFVNCDCCGKGTCEVKCPHCAKDKKLDKAAEEKFCLINDGTSLRLNKKHPYYYQVQAQIFICDVEYCDFIVWTERDIHIERILPDIAFWEEALMKSTKLFNVAVLPELLGRWLSRTSVVTVANQSTENATDEIHDDDDDDEEGPWCYCQEYLEGHELIGCDNNKCTVVWFHMSCLNIVSPPEGKWYCPTCEKLDTLVKQ